MLPRCSNKQITVSNKTVLRSAINDLLTAELGNQESEVFIQGQSVKSFALFGILTPVGVLIGVTNAAGNWEHFINPCILAIYSTVIIMSLTGHGALLVEFM